MIRGIIILLLGLTIPAKAQNPDDFKIFVFKHRYDSEVQEYIEKSPSFEQIKVLQNYMIDPKSKGIIDFEAVTNNIRRIYPDPEMDGILCINLENRLYHDLRSTPSHSAAYKRAVTEFTRLVNVIKFERPNLEIGIYGIPFRTYFKSQLKWNEDHKFDSLLAKVDILFPSLYIMYPDRQRGARANLDYILTNLATTFDYADRLEKRVIPFFWYLVHPSNRKYGLELLGFDEIENYLNLIKEFESDEGNTVEGIVWWESPTPFREKTVKSAGRSRHAKILDMNSIFMRYLRKYLEGAATD